MNDSMSLQHAFVPIFQTSTQVNIKPINIPNDYISTVTITHRLVLLLGISVRYAHSPAGIIFVVLSTIRRARAHPNSNPLNQLRLRRLCTMYTRTHIYTLLAIRIIQRSHDLGLDMQRYMVRSHSQSRHFLVAMSSHATNVRYEYV